MKARDETLFNALQRMVLSATNSTLEREPSCYFPLQHTPKLTTAINWFPIKEGTFTPQFSLLEMLTSPHYESQAQSYLPYKLRPYKYMGGPSAHNIIYKEVRGVRVVAKQSKGSNRFEPKLELTGKNLNFLI